MKADRGLRIIACIAAAWSFTALVSTEQLLPGVVVAGYFLYVLICFPQNPLARVGDIMWVFINVVVTLATVFYAYQDLGSALVYGTVFLQVQKIVRAKTPDDYLWVFLISFFQVVLAAAITVHLTFLFVVLGFLGLAVVGLTFLTLERSRRSVEKDAAGSEGLGRPIALNALNGDNGRPAEAKVPAHVVLPRGYLVRLLGVCLAVVLVSCLFFVAIPRLAARRVFWRLRPLEPPTITGFSDQVQAGALVNLVKDRTLVMRAWVRRGRQRRAFRPPYLRLRGLSLNYFDGVRWSGNRWARDKYRSRNRVESPDRFPFNYDPQNSLTVLISQNMAQAKWLFGPPYVERVDSVNSGEVLFYPAMHAFRMTSSGRNWFDYIVTAYTEPPLLSQIEAIANIAPVDGDAGRGTGDPLRWRLTEDERYWFTALPRQLVGRSQMKELAETLTRDAQTPVEKISRLSRFFRGNFNYSLEGGAQSIYYLRDFLFNTRKGHCEAFAMGMAVLCRILDMPARVVTGFYTSEYNRYQKFFYVRQCHAHTWVEVWLDGYGWMTVDPTPPSALQSDTAAFAIFAGLGEYWDAWTMYWRRNIVDYSLADQLDLLKKAAVFLRTKLFRGEPFGGNAPRFELRSKFDTAGGTGGRSGSVVLLVVAGLLAAWLLHHRIQQRKAQRALIKGAARLADCPVDFYAKILKVLAAEGWRMQPDQTPAEFALQVAAAIPDLEQFVPVTRTYYRIRFSEDGLQPDERRIVERFTAQIAQVRKKRGLSALAPGTAA